MPDLEARVAALEAALSRLSQAPKPSPEPAESDGFWLLDDIDRRYPEGAVVYGAHVPLPTGEVRWQIDRPTGVVLDADWTPSATVLAALGHPLRLKLLNEVLHGRTTTAELADDPDLGTTGQLHHHLRQLVAAGWLQSVGHGRYAVPPQRIVPLLAIITATH